MHADLDSLYIFAASVVSFCNLKGILSIVKCMVQPQYKSQETAREFELLLEITCGEPIRAQRNISKVTREMAGNINVLFIVQKNFNW